jgi:putative ABC transport system substrate-binding protein
LPRRLDWSVLCNGSVNILMSFPRSPWFTILVAAFCLWAATGPSLASDRYTILAVKTQDIPFYSAVLDSFTHSLTARCSGRGVTITQISLTGDDARDTQALRAQLQKNPDLIFTLGTDATRLVAAAHPTPPVLFSMILNPVSLGVAHSLDAPGGRFTGTTLLVSPGKQLDALLQVAPQVKKVGVLYTDGDPTSLAYLNDARQEAQTLGVTIVAQAVPADKDVNRATLEHLAAQVNALWLIPDPASTGAGALPLTFDVAHSARIPILGASGPTVHMGALVALSADLGDMGDLDAEMALGLLQGGDPATTRVLGPRRTTLSINLQAAQAIGLTIPDSLLRLADEVIDADSSKK